MAKQLVTVIQRSELKPSELPNYGVMFRYEAEFISLSAARENSLETIDEMLLAGLAVKVTYISSRWLKLTTKHYEISFVIVK